MDAIGSADSAFVEPVVHDMRLPKCRQVRATLRETSPARCHTLNRQAHNRVVGFHKFE
jgi:hypothetical protein